MRVVLQAVKHDYRLCDELRQAMKKRRKELRKLTKQLKQGADAALGTDAGTSGPGTCIRTCAI